MDIDKKLEELSMQRAQAEAMVFKIQGAIELLMEIKEAKKEEDVKKKK